MNIRRATLLFLSLILLVTCNKNKDKHPEEIKKADSLFKAKNYENAKKIYNKALDLQPENEYLRKKLYAIDSILSYEKLNAHYQEILKIADSLFDNNLYAEALQVYENALELKPNELYPMDKLEEINAMISDYTKKTNDPYHIIVGCFAVEENAIKLRNKLQNEGFNAQFIPRMNGTMNAVTYTSNPDIHDAYNNLNKAKRKVHKDAWVLYHVF